jgi:hypothetical protein
MMGFGGTALGGSAFTTRQVGRLPAFRAEVVSVPFGGTALSLWILACKGVRRGKT